MELPTKRRIALILSIAFIVFLTWTSVTFQQILSRYIPYFEKLALSNQILSAAIFIGLAILSTMFSSFSSVPLVPIAVLVWGNWLTALFLFLGWTTGDVLSYWIAYYAGNPIAKRLIPFEKIEFYRKKIPPDAEFKLVFFFIMSMPSEIPGYTLEILRYNFKRYLPITAFGEFIWAPVTAFAGLALIEKNLAFFAAAIGFMLLFFAYSFNLFQKYLQRKN